MSTRFTIQRLGAQGDGIAAIEGREVFIPFTLPGETVTAARQKDRAALIAVLEPSPLRVEPACRHFTECGGCALQHMEEGAYRAWKRERVVQALKAKGIACEVGDLVAASRRRAARRLHRAPRARRMLLGFNRHSHPRSLRGGMPGHAACNVTRSAGCGNCRPRLRHRRSVPSDVTATASGWTSQHKAPAHGGKTAPRAPPTSSSAKAFAGFPWTANRHGAEEPW